MTNNSPSTFVGLGSLCVETQDRCLYCGASGLVVVYDGDTLALRGWHCHGCVTDFLPSFHGENAR